MATTEEQRRRALVVRLKRVQRRLTAEAWLRLAVAPSWAFAVAVVGWHLVVQRGHLSFAACALAVYAAALVLRARGRGVSEATAAAVADRQVGAGGLLLTRLEIPVGAWELDVNQLARRIIAPRIDVRRPAALLTLALLFVVAGLLVPPPRSTAPRPNAAATAVVERLEERLDALALEEPDDTAARAELERLQAELDRGAFDAPDWEAADALEQASEWRAAEASAELARAEAAARELAGALGAQAGERAAADARDELERALTALDDGGAGRPSEAREWAGAREAGAEGEARTGGAGEGGAGTAPGHRAAERASAEALARALEERRERLERPFAGSQGAGEGRGRAEGRGSPRPRGRHTSSAPGRSKEGAAGEASGARASNGTSQGDGKPGSGGVSRGPGAAELSFGEEAEIDPSRLRFDPLTPGLGGEPGELRGLRFADPRGPEGAGGSRAEARVEGAAGGRGEGGRGRPLRPRNRAAVERYFGGAR